MVMIGAGVAAGNRFLCNQYSSRVLVVLEDDMGIFNLNYQKYIQKIFFKYCKRLTNLKYFLWIQYKEWQISKYEVISVLI